MIDFQHVGFPPDWRLADAEQGQKIAPVVVEGQFRRTFVPACRVVSNVAAAIGDMAEKVEFIALGDGTAEGQAEFGQKVRGRGFARVCNRKVAQNSHPRALRSFPYPWVAVLDSHRAGSQIQDPILSQNHVLATPDLACIGSHLRIHSRLLGSVVNSIIDCVVVFLGWMSSLLNLIVNCHRVSQTIFFD
nr:hypothetical protein [Thalassovita mangrovi]